jgi:hypothetical protein
MMRGLKAYYFADGRKESESADLFSRRDPPPHRRRSVVDVTLGPWTVAKGVDKEYKALAAAMGDEAMKTASKTAGFTPKEAENGKPAASGFTISGTITTVLKKGRTIHIRSLFTVWVDGTFSNVKELAGDGSADSAPAEDAVRAITENRITRLLLAIKSAQVRKAS